MPYTKLFNSIITSSLWLEPDHTRLVWITMLALADKHGEVQASVPGLARLAGVPVEACRAALDALAAPDPDSRTKTAEGRRITEIDGGWELINHAKYRRMASEEDKREANARRQERFRNREDSNAEVTPSNAEVTPDDHKQRADTHSKAKATIQPSGTSEVEFPPVLNNPAFIAAWQLWQDFRKQAKIKAYVPIGAKAQLNRLAKLGSSAAIAAIENSVANGYTGIFEPKQNGASRPTNNTPKPTPADPDGWADWLTAENRPYVPHFYAPSIVKDVFRQGATA